MSKAFYNESKLAVGDDNTELPLGFKRLVDAMAWLVFGAASLLGLVLFSVYFGKPLWLARMTCDVIIEVCGKLYWNP